MLRIERLTKLFALNSGCQDVSLACKKGEIHGVLGKNGSGKTTLFRCLLGLIPLDEGSVILESSLSTIRQFGYLPEERSVIADLRVTEMIDFFASLKQMSHKEIREEKVVWLQKLKCEHLKFKRLRECSKGNQQKIQLICSLIHQPDVLILDEPLTGLDISNVRLFKQVIADYAHSGKIVLLSSHQYEEIEPLCDSLTVLDKSKVILQGKLGDIKRNHPIKTVSVSEDAQMIYALQKGITEIRHEGNTTRYLCKSEADAINIATLALKNRDGRTIKVESLTLKDLLGDQQ
ncbi:MAG: sodium ABC transporter ATP-binding protein [Firmicutes bacterium HGW-Firmicutes-20]|jgi:ABC-2 type transport system ATP-binding protein|nr:MAG: sodium ABC transporter ATP-binding protein [Firmicutes bacterium HGW-Firmicutes-20]PKM68238.1 MAG: sodium ABC transporter ATP-binding protein [Firmicutes bacterium HGW-Firmicutes-19]